MMDTKPLGNSIMGLASASELQTLASNFLTQYAKHLIAFNTVRGTENEPSFILISEPVPTTYMYVYLYNSSLYLSIHFRNDLYFFIVY
jgi:hypothetical protein